MANLSAANISEALASKRRRRGWVSCPQRSAQTIDNQLLSISTGGIMQALLPRIFERYVQRFDRNNVAYIGSHPMPHRCPPHHSCPHYLSTSPRDAVICFHCEPSL
mmetsp:Transcript_7686/g.21398  ORF Transcript_7686/g.21398 Transcript_7686/m.21398 type:complete len:106 (-) Transcript_7686:3542-3859(-)